MLLTCNLSKEYHWIAILYKQIDFSLIWQTIHKNVSAVRSGGVYEMRSTTIWLRLL